MWSNLTHALTYRNDHPTTDDVDATTLQRTHERSQANCNIFFQSRRSFKLIMPCGRYYFVIKQTTRTRNTAQIHPKTNTHIHTHIHKLYTHAQQTNVQGLNIYFFCIRTARSCRSRRGKFFKASNQNQKSYFNIIPSRRRASAIKYSLWKIDNMHLKFEKKALAENHHDDNVQT